MELEPYVAQVAAHLASAAALGDERTRVTADALAAAAEPAMRLALLAAVSAAADEITAGLLDSPAAAQVAVRLDGTDLRIEVSSGQPEAAPAPADEAEATARISLRLSDALKADIESAARADSVSVNTWLVRAAAGALRRAGDRAGWSREPWDRTGHRITGWING